MGTAPRERPWKGALGQFQSKCCPLSGVGLTSRDRCDVPHVTAPGEGLLVGTWVKLTRPSRVPSGHPALSCVAVMSSAQWPRFGGADLLLAPRSPGLQCLPDPAWPEPRAEHGCTAHPRTRQRKDTSCVPACWHQKEQQGRFRAACW